jgi:hypothetical protein
VIMPQRVTSPRHSRAKSSCPGATKNLAGWERTSSYSAWVTATGSKQPASPHSHRYDAGSGLLPTTASIRPFPARKTVHSRQAELKLIRRERPRSQPGSCQNSGQARIGMRALNLVDEPTRQAIVPSMGAHKKAAKGG